MQNFPKRNSYRIFNDLFLNLNLELLRFVVFFQLQSFNQVINAMAKSISETDFFTWNWMVIVLACIFQKIYFFGTYRGRLTKRTLETFSSGTIFSFYWKGLKKYIDFGEILYFKFSCTVEYNFLKTDASLTDKLQIRMTK